MPRTIFLWAILALACGDDTAPTVPPSPVQSAPQILRYVLAPEPDLAIGLADGPEEYLFNDIAGAVRLDNGDVIVAVRGLHEIRRFGPDGTHLWTTGRQGEGPGEFRYVELLRGCTSDSVIVAYGARNGTINTFHGDGTLVASDRFEQPPWGYNVGCTPNRRLVFSDYGEPSGQLEFVYRWVQSLAYADEPGSRIRVLRTDVPGADRHMAVIPGMAPVRGPRPWARELAFAVGQHGVWMTTGDDYEIEFLDWTGATTRRIRWEGPDQVVTVAYIDAHYDRICRGYQLLGRDDWQQECDLYWEEEAPLLPQTFPAATRILATDDGYLWVEHFRRPGEDRQWLLFDREGKWVSTLEVPRRMFLQDAGRDWILARHTTDDLGVEMLKVYPIEPSQEVTR